MKEEIEYALNKFKDAVAALGEGVRAAKDELDKDGVIQRFEFCFELLWKTVKIFVEDKGIECRSPKECLKSAFKVGYIKNEQIFLEMLEDRNKTAHIYNKKESEKIFQKIKSDYFPSMENILRRLETEIKGGTI